jgi:hypothetical protein
MKHAQRTEKYIRLIFNSYGVFFFWEVHAHYRHELVFSGDFQGQEGVHIMHQCALCNPNDGNYKIVLKISKSNINTYGVCF